MALFPGAPGSAIRAAIGMQRRLSELNENRRAAKTTDSDPDNDIRIGVGIHTGSIMLGTIGGENRMDGTVISDAVNLTARLEGLTKTFHSLILASETALETPAGEDFQTRFLGRVQVKGKTVPIAVFEILNAEEPESQRLKIDTLDDFQGGLELYQSGELSGAMALFEKVLHKNPHDGAALLYTNRCNYYQKIGLPDMWDGTEAMENK